MALRAKVVLLAAEGLGLREIEGKTGLNWPRCLKRRKRFLERGLEGLQDQAGRGRPQSITPEERVSVLALACTTPADGSSRWRPLRGLQADQRMTSLRYHRDKDGKTWLVTGDAMGMWS